MILDARKLPNGHIVKADICIVGAGAAGIAMGLEFDKTSIKVAIIESGGFELDAKTQSLYKGESTGYKNFPLDMNRLRYFGGTTGHWEGHCRPFDAFDLSKRDWIPYSGWPLSFEEFEPYLKKSQPILGLGKYDYHSLDEYAEKLGLPTLPFDGERLISVMKMTSPPTRFGKAYKQDLKKSKNVSVYLHSNVLELTSNKAGSHVTDVKVQCIDGPKYKVNAKTFIMAAGGLENARLMLLSDKSVSQGLGNSNDLVGRFYTDHLMILPLMNISFSQEALNLDLYFSNKGHKLNGNLMYGVLAASEELTRQEKLTRFRLHLHDNPPVYRGEKGIGNIFSGIDHGKENSTGEDKSVAVHMIMEPIPNPENRVMLTDKKDFLGQRKITVNWELSETELANAYRIAEIAALEFSRMGYGRGYAPIFKNANKWPDFFRPGQHHCGTTRMSDNPTTGVVDKQCRVFDVDNLYVAGSSVFPTIGHTNPTLNLVALALRLADHLKKSKP